MCLVLKSDNGKVVSIANGQTHRVTQPSSTVLVYRFFPKVSIKHQLGKIIFTFNLWYLKVDTKNGFMASFFATKGITSCFSTVQGSLDTQRTFYVR